MKICSRCKQSLPRENFVNKLESRDGLASRCRDCMREIQWLLRYKITPADYHNLLEQQGGVCAICHGKQVGRGKYFSVDHNHQTGAVRGLLCTNCNVLIGYARDDIVILQSAINYLSKG